MRANQVRGFHLRVVLLHVACRADMSALAGWLAGWLSVSRRLSCLSLFHEVYFAKAAPRPPARLPLNPNSRPKRKPSQAMTRCAQTNSSSRVPHWNQKQNLQTAVILASLAQRTVTAVTSLRPLLNCQLCSLTHSTGPSYSTFDGVSIVRPLPRPRPLRLLSSAVRGQEGALVGLIIV